MPKPKYHWTREEAGWWTAGVIGWDIAVCKERDGKWHSYVTDDDTPLNSPSFSTMQEAMVDAEKRKKCRVKT